MKSRRMRLLTVLVATTMVLTTALVGCKGKSSPTSTPTNGGGTAANNGVKTPPKTPEFNKEKVMRRPEGWPKPPLFQGNYFGSGGVGPCWMYVFEPMFQFVRSTDKVYNILAESLTNEGDVSTIKLRAGVTWQDGEPFTSKDIWSYYMVNNGCEVFKYLSNIELVDDLTIKLTWNNPAPFPEIRQYYLAQEREATIPYHLYKQYADKAWELIQKAKPTTDKTKWGPLGREITDDIRKELDANWQSFIKSGPKMPMGTGPYTVKTVTATDMIMEKNPKYWNIKNMYFDKIWAKQVPELSSQYAMLKAGQIDTYDGTQPRDILEGILNGNKDMLHYRMFDPACVGMMFNTRRTWFQDLKVRQAFVYIIDKTKVREVGNYYGKEYPKLSALALPPSEEDRVLTDDTKAKLTDYTTNLDKAAQLLQEAGWTKGSDGIWKMKDGKTPDITIGAPSGWFPAINAGQVVAEQYTKFGIPTKVKAVDGSVYYTNADKGEYDISMDWVDVFWGFGDPWNSLRNMYWWGPKAKIGFPTVHTKDKDGKDVDTGKLNLKVTGPDGQEYDVDKCLNDYTTIQDPTERKKIANALTFAFNENAWAVNLFQNATGTWFNMKMIDSNWPMQDEIKKYDRDMPLPTKPEDIERIAETNYGFGGYMMFFTGEYWPR